MSFILSKILWIVLAPGTLLTLLASGGAVLQYLGSERLRCWGRRLSALSAFGLALFLFLPLGGGLTVVLEGRFPVPATLPEHVDGVIVLGGMVDPSSSAVWGRPTLNHGADRLTEFAFLARRYPEAKMVFTGGSGSLTHPELREAPIARAILERIGVATDRMIFETESRNTYENAIFSQALAHPKPTETWILVTSAMHMPRSVGIFRRIGWNVTPFPVAHRSGVDTVTWMPFDVASGLYRFEEALHECVGLVAYYLMGRSDSVFPSP
ncbi:DUF218 domain-containing protein [Azospirillaceae bacterium]